MSRPRRPCRIGRTRWLGVLLLLALLPGSPTTRAEEPTRLPPAPVETGAGEVPEQPTRVRRAGDLVQVFTGDVSIPANEERDGSVVCVGGEVVVEGEVTGDVVVILGSLRLRGEVGGDVVGVLSDLELQDATIRGQLVNVLGGLRRDHVDVHDQVFNLGFPGRWFPGILALLTWFRVLGLLGVFVLLVLVVAVAPERVRLIAEEAPVRYVTAFLVGLLGYIGLWLVLTLLSVTLIVLPVAWVVYVVLKWLALAGMFCALGQRLGRALGREFSPLGAVLLVYGVYAAVLLVLSALGLAGLLAIWAVRILFLGLFQIPAFGLLLLTRAGTKSSLPPASAIAAGGPAAAGPPPPSPPPPAAPSASGPPAR